MAVLVISCGVYAAKNGNGNGNNGHNGGHGFICDDIKNISELKLDSNKPTVAVFYSQTCPSCTDIKEPFNAFVKKHKSDVNCAAIDVNAQGVRSFAQSLKISQVPTIVVIHKRVGAASEAALDSYLSQMTGMTAFAQHQAGAGKVVSKPVPTKTSENGKIIPMDEEFEEEDYLMPTEKPLQVKPEDIEELYEEEDIIKSPKLDDEFGMDIMVRGSGKSGADVMP